MPVGRGPERRPHNMHRSARMSPGNISSPLGVCLVCNNLPPPLKSFAGHCFTFQHAVFHSLWYSLWRESGDRFERHCLPYSIPFLCCRLSLLHTRSRLALVLLHRVQHDLDRLRLCVSLVSLGPVVAYGVGEDVAVLVEVGRGDAAADVGVALESVLGVFVPEVERAVRAGRREGAVDGVERDVVDGVDAGNVSLRRVAVALEGEVGAVWLLACDHETEPTQGEASWHLTYPESLSSTYWIAHLPSILPIAKPAASAKQLTTRVCHLRGLCRVL